MRFRFSPRPNRADEIDWHAWSPTAFARAEEEDRPVFLSLSTTWCRWCAVMDETSFSDPNVIGKLNREFVPIRVDADERPDLFNRYGMGGWPSFAILTPEAELMTGATYQPPDELLEVLVNVTDVWMQNRDDIRREVAELHAHFAQAAPRARAIEPGDFLIEGSLAPALPSFDEEYGGFGRGSKFPRVDILEALLHVQALMPEGSGTAKDKAAPILTTTLDAIIRRGLHDSVDGGFFRFATSREWEFPHHEKLLADNAALVRLLAMASLVLSRSDYLQTAVRTQAYLDSQLWLDGSGAYAGSQAHDPDYYDGTTAEERLTLTPPPIDERCFASTNALAVRALAQMYTVTVKEDYAERAARVATTLAAWRSPRGLVRRSDTPDALDTILVDQVDTLCALLDLHDAGIRQGGPAEYLRMAEELWNCIDAAFTVPNSALLADIGAAGDVEGPGHVETAGDHARGDATLTDLRLGRMTRTDTPVAENSRAATALARLGRLVGSDAYLGRARSILAGITPMAAEVGNYAAELATAAIIVLKGVDGSAAELTRRIRG